MPADLATPRGGIGVLAAPPAAGKTGTRRPVQRRIVVVVVLVERVNGRLARDSAVKGALRGGEEKSPARGRKGGWDMKKKKRENQKGAADAEERQKNRCQPSETTTRRAKQGRSEKVG